MEHIKTSCCTSALNLKKQSNESDIQLSCKVLLSGAFTNQTQLHTVTGRGKEKKISAQFEGQWEKPQDSLTFLSVSARVNRYKGTPYCIILHLAISMENIKGMHRVSKRALFVFAKIKQQCSLRCYTLCMSNRNVCINKMSPLFNQQNAEKDWHREMSYRIANISIIALQKTRKTTTKTLWSLFGISNGWF